MFGLFKGAHTPVITDAHGKVKANSIAVMEKVHLGGIDQWVVIRGHNVNNPLLFFLAGGPGGADWGPIRKFTPQLEEHFTLVHWAPRGAIKTYHTNVPDPQTMTLEHILADLHQLVLQTTRRFGQQKVFVAGQSVGSMYALLFAQKHPELVHAHIGINQVVDRAAEELISYEYTLAHARKMGKAKAVADLEKIGAPQGGLYANIQETLTQRKHMSVMGIVSHNPKRLMAWQKALIFAPEMTWGERLKAIKAVSWSMEQLWPELCRQNFFQSVPEVKVPVFLVLGQHDHIINTPLSLRWLEQVKAPHKQAFIFEQSGHIACYEEPERFAQLMIEQVRPVAAQSAAQAHAG